MQDRCQKTALQFFCSLSLIGNADNLTFSICGSYVILLQAETIVDVYPFCFDINNITVYFFLFVFIL